MQRETILYLSQLFLPETNMLPICEPDFVRYLTDRGSADRLRTLLQNPDQIRASLANFSNEANGHWINTTSKRYIKQSVTSNALEDVGLSLVSPVGINDKRFTQDGHHSLGITYKNGNNQDVWFGTLSFSCGSDISFYNPSIDINFPQPFPVIVQLQGRKFSKDGGTLDEKNTYHLLSSLRWEQLLIDLMIMWAIKEGVPWLYILPASMNIHAYFAGQEKKERFGRRYDGTARHCGFKMQPNGLWGMTCMISI